jgi:hypothetical protein
LSKINTTLKNIIKPSLFTSSVRDFIKNFDDLEKVSKKIIEKENDLDLSDYNLSSEKKLYIDDITKGLLNKEMLDANLQSPLRKILYRYSTTNINLKTAESEIRRFVTSEDGAGFAERYVKTLAIESLHRFDGGINQRVATDFNLDAFRIVGSLIVSSESQCIHMIKEIGDLGRFAVNGKYPTEALPEIIAMLKKNYKGVNKDLNISNYFELRNHWGCRHQFIPTRLLERDKKELESRRIESVSQNISIELSDSIKKTVPTSLDNYEKELGITVDKSIFKLLRQKVDLVHDDPKSERGAYFAADLNIVNIPFDQRRRESKWYSEAVVYHEYGHVIDNQREYYKSEDVKKIMSKHREIFSENNFSEFKRLHKELYDKGGEFRDKGEFDDMNKITAALDTIMSLNKEFGIGHPPKYWDREWNSEKEFIAHLFENKFIGNDHFKKAMPELYEDMINFKLQ